IAAADADPPARDPADRGRRHGGPPARGPGPKADEGWHAPDWRAMYGSYGDSPKKNVWRSEAPAPAGGDREARDRRRDDRPGNEGGLAQGGDERGAGPRREERGAGPRRDERGPGPRYEERGPGPRHEERGTGPRRDERGGGPRRDERGAGPRHEERG